MCARGTLTTGAESPDAVLFKKPADDDLVTEYFVAQDPPQPNMTRECLWQKVWRCAFVALVVTLWVAAGAWVTGGRAAAATGTAGMINVRSATYGARGNGVADDYRAIQSALDTACKESRDGIVQPQVFLPPGTYKISRPLVLHCTGIQFAGSGELSTKIVSGFGNGPVMVLVPGKYPRMTTVPGLFGRGRAFWFPKRSSDGYALDLRAAPTMDLNGLRALTVEFTIRFARFGFDAVIGSGDYSGRNRAVEIFFINDGAMGAYLTTNGKRHHLQAYGLHLRKGINYHVALVYDGKMVGLYLNGRRIASQAARGPITQKVDEGMALGGTPKGPFAMGLIRGVAGGFAVGSIRISDIARYSSNFAPPRHEFSNDAHTLLLLNAGSDPLFSVAHSRDGDVWLPRMDFTYGVMSFAHVHDMQLVGGGILAIQNDFCSLDRILVQGARIGLQFFNNSYRSVVTRVKVIGGSNSWIGFLEDVNSSPVDLTDAHFDGAQIGLYSAGSGIYERLFVSPDTHTVYPIELASQDAETNFTLIQPTVDFEPVGHSPMRAAMRFLRVSKAVIVSGAIEGYNGVPLLEVDGGDSITFIGTELNSGEANRPKPGELIRILSPPMWPLVLFNPQIRSGPGVPLSRTPSAVSVVGGAGGREVMVGGELKLERLARPGAPVVYAKGKGRSYTYFLVGHDLAGGTTRPSPGTTVEGSPAPDNRVCAKPQPGVYYFDVLRGDTSHKVGTIAPFQYPYSGAGYDYCFTDKVSSPAKYTPPVRNTTGELKVAGIVNGCSGVVRLSNGVATVRDPCIDGSRPTACTDNSAEGAFACSAAASSGKVVLHGVGSHRVSWFQM